MWYLLYDPAYPLRPFEIFYDNAPNSYCYTCFHPGEFTHPDFSLFHDPVSNDLDITNWCADISGDQAYPLHQFTSKPSVADVINVLNLHPELLI